MHWKDVMLCPLISLMLLSKPLSMPEAKKGEQVIMKITGVLVDLLVKIAPETYGPYVVF